MSKNVLVLGATGRIGRIVSKNLLDKLDVNLTVYVRNKEKLDADIGNRANVISGDIMDTERLSAAMLEQNYVVCAIDGDLLKMAQSIVKASKGKNISHIMWVTGAGIHHEVPGPAGKMLDLLVKAQPEYVKAADLIADSGIPYTLIRATHLTDGTNAKYYLQEEGRKLHANRVDRVAVAAFITNIIDGEVQVKNMSLGVTN